jgi:hypothetical protein
MSGVYALYIMCDYYARCYGCFSEDLLIKCDRCVYNICKVCILHDEFSTVVPALCKHDECAYTYLDEKEKSDQHCYACSLKPVSVKYRCRTCNLSSGIDVGELTEAIKLKATQTGVFERVTDIFNHSLVFYTVLDLENGTTKIEKFWQVPHQKSTFNPDTDGHTNTYT